MEYYVKRSAPAPYEYAVTLPYQGLVMVEKGTQPVLEVNETDAGALISYGGWEHTDHAAYVEYTTPAPQNS